MLKGALDDFALTDIFRLISLAKKTGRLEVLRQAGRGAVFFGEGDVLYAESSLVREPLGQKLTRAGALTEGQLRRALDEHASTGLRLGRVLLSAGWVSEEDLEDAVRGQTEDAVFDLLRWEVGEFTWTSGERVDAEVPVAVSVENLIMEASRRLDELDIITRKIPSVDAVMAMAAKPPEGAVEINITPDEWRLLVLVNGSRSVANIAEIVGVDDFDALKTLYGMLSAGLVEVVTPGHEGFPEQLGGTRTEAAPPAETVAPEPVVVAQPSVEPEPGPAAPSEVGRPAARHSVTEPRVGPEDDIASAESPFGPEVDAPSAHEDGGPGTEVSGGVTHEREETGVASSRDADVADDAEPELEVTLVEEGAAAEPSEPGAPAEAWTEDVEPPPAVPEAWDEDVEPEPGAPREASTEDIGLPQAGADGGWMGEAEPPASAPAGTEVEEEPTRDLQGAVAEPAEPDEPRLEALDDQPEPGSVEETGPVVTPADEAEPDLGSVDPGAALDEPEPDLGPEPEPGATEDDVPEGPRLERSAAVRELAGLWGDSDQPVRRPSSQRAADPAPDDDARRRVEDDEDINRGLISKLIDGVKGL